MMFPDSLTASRAEFVRATIVGCRTCPGVDPYRPRAFYSDIRRLEEAPDVVFGAAAARTGCRCLETPAPTLLIFGGCNPQSAGVEPPAGMTLDPAGHSRDRPRYGSRRADFSMFAALPSSSRHPHSRAVAGPTGRISLQLVRLHSIRARHECPGREAENVR